MYLSQLPVPAWLASTQNFSLPKSSEICWGRSKLRSEMPRELCHWPQRRRQTQAGWQVGWDVSQSQASERPHSPSPPGPGILQETGRKKKVPLPVLTEQLTGRLGSDEALAF